jgi:hypothetical protein
MMRQQPCWNLLTQEKFTWRKNFFLHFSIQQGDNHLSVLIKITENSPIDVFRCFKIKGLDRVESPVETPMVSDNNPENMMEEPP